MIYFILFGGANELFSDLIVFFAIFFFVSIFIKALIEVIKNNNKKK